MRALFTLCFLMFSIAARAEVDLKTFLETYDGADIAEKHHLAERLLDMQYGMAWTNAVIEAETGQHLYCPPETSALNGEQLVDMLRKKAAEGPRLNDISFGLAILSTLRMTFPCAEKSN
jgi:putative SOS response-associated peptidase YedK